MKKIFVASVILVCLATALPAAAAIEGFTGEPRTVATGAPAPTTAAAPTTATTPAPTAAPAAERTWCEWAVGKDACSVFSLATVYWLLGVLSWLFYRFSVAMFAYAAWWLDGTLFYLIVEMGKFVNASAANGVREAWVMIRDICNLLIIGGFVMVGISTILNISQYAADKFLSRLIIAALLINFSYFFAGVIIDATNFVAIAAFKSDFISNDCPVKMGGGSSGSGGVFGIANRGIAAATGDYAALCSFGASFAIETKLHSWDTIECMARARSGTPCNKVNGAYKSPTAGGALFTSTAGITNPENFYWELFVICLLAGIFIMSAAFVFISGAFLLVARFAVLIILLVTSPFGIAGINIPYIDNYAGRWWDLLISQSVFAPVFIILMGISFKVTGGFISFLEAGGGSYADTSAVQGSYIEGNLSLFISFFVGIGFLWFALLAARQISASATELKGLYDFANNAGGKAFWAPKRLLDIPVGLAAQPLADSLAARTRAGTWARTISVGLGSGLRSWSRLGTGKKHEKSAWEESAEAAKEGHEHRESGEHDREYFEGGYFFGIPYYGRGRGALAALEPIREKDKKRAQKAYEHAKPEDVRDHVGQKAMERMAGDDLFPEGFLEKLNKSDKFSSHDRSAFNAAYFHKVNAHADKGNWQGASEAFEELTEVERNILLAERGELRSQKEFLGYLKSDTFESTIKNSSPADQAKARGSRQDSLHAQLTDTKTTPAQKEAVVKRMSNNERAKMNGEATKAALPHMTPAQVRHLHANGTPEARKVIESSPEASKHMKGTYLGDDETK